MTAVLALLKSNAVAAEAATAITLQKIDAANAAMSMKIDVMREDVAAKVAESGEKIDALKRETNVKLCKIDSRLQEAEEAAEKPRRTPLWRTMHTRPGLRNWRRR